MTIQHKYGYIETIFNQHKVFIMCPVIRISDQLYSRLEGLAEGFDTPANLIERLLDQCDGINKPVHKKATNKPLLVFTPSDENDFKEQLLKHKRASVRLHKQNGTIENRMWTVNRFSKDSNLRGNLWSGIMRGWKTKGIIKAEFSIDDNIKS